MIRRGGSWLVPEQTTRFEAGDRLLAFGSPEALAGFREPGGPAGAA